jgi:hypothetical protein
MCNTKQRKACLERFVCICCMANHQSHNTNINIHLGATPDDKVLLPRGGLCLNLFQICTVRTRGFQYECLGLLRWTFEHPHYIYT